MICVDRTELLLIWCLQLEVIMLFRENRVINVQHRVHQ